MALDKKQVGAIFLYELKTGGKAAETGRKVNNAFGFNTVKTRTMQ